MAKIDPKIIIDRVEKTSTYEKLRNIETNIVSQGAMNAEIEAAVKAHYGVLARRVVAEKAGIDLGNLSPAEEKIVRAVAEYVGLMKRDKKTASRTFQQLNNRGLIGAAETAVSKSKPTQGFSVLEDAGRADLSYEQIIIDHPEEFSERALWFARRALGKPSMTDKPPATEGGSTQERSELLLTWLKSRRPSSPGQITPYTNVEAAEAMGIGDIKKFGRAHGNIQSRLDFACYRLGFSPLGLAAKEPFSRAWKWHELGWDYPISEMQRAAQGRAWSDGEFDSVLEVARTLPGSAAAVWKEEVAAHPAAIKSWAERLAAATDEPHWVLVCNPKKWAIDDFLTRDIEVDSWGVRPADRDKFAPGQLAIVRVGQDRRSSQERAGRPHLEAGIYAICQVLTEPYEATGASDEFWSPGSAREPGWPTVGIRYLQTFLEDPLSIDLLRVKFPAAPKLLIDGFQASSFPISAQDFRAVIALLGVSAEELPDPSDAPNFAKALHDVEEKYRDALPEVKERQSRYIERGPVGARVKWRNDFKCQVCEALGCNPHAFIKPNGEPYVEAHHVMPVSKLEKGSLHAANIMTVCANHHRQLHFGGIEVTISEADFKFEIDGQAISILRPNL